MGWSVADSDLSLGEDKLSYGYGGTGRKSTNKQFQLYGESYGPGDLISCFMVSALVLGRAWTVAMITMSMD